MMSDDEPTPDAAEPDAAPDAAIPIAGKACTTSVVEAGRITGANLTPSLGGLFARDADNDGKADVLVFEFVSATGTDYTYRIRLFRQGTTGFLAPTVSTIIIPQFGPERVTVGDFNGDMMLDVAWIYSTETPQRSPFVYVALQSATTHLFSVTQPRVDVSACKSSTDERTFGLAVMDWDRDGKDDLLTTVSYAGLGAAPEGLTLLKGTATGLGAGTCVASATVSMAGVPNVQAARQLIVGDFDGDGDKDLVANIFDKGRLFYSTAASTFGGSPPAEGAIPSTGQIHANVIKGRTQNDLIHADVRTAGTEVRRYVLDPTTGVTVKSVAMLPEKDPTGSLIFRGIVAGDFNGDGLSDALVVGRQPNATSNITFAMTCDRAAQWDQATGVFPDDASNLRAIDIDGDGRTEVLADAGADAVIYRIQ